jgi:hypothetical protein
MKFPKLNETKQNKTWKKKNTPSDVVIANVSSIPSLQFVAKISHFSSSSLQNMVMYISSFARPTFIYLLL